MPTVNIPPRVRFVLYLLGAIASLGVTYAINKGWAGDAEVQLVMGVVSLLQLLAAAKTDLSGSAPAEGYQGRHEAEPSDEDHASAIRARNAEKGI